MNRNALILAAMSLFGAAAGIAGKGRAADLDIYTDIVIAAPPDRVWSVFADNSRYADWNPYHVKVDGDLETGHKLHIDIRKPDGTRVSIRPHVMKIVENRELVWGGGIRGIFRGVHVFELEPVGDNCTRLVQQETFDGLFVRFAHLDGIAEGYERMNHALKEHLEAATASADCRA